MDETQGIFRTNAATWLFIIAGVLYLLGVWYHIPYGGGHVYSDIVTVFQNRLEDPSFSPQNLPLVNNFVEYLPITSYFMYAMAVLGKYVPVSLPANLLGDYYRYTSVFLVIPSFLLITELLKLCDILGIRTKHRRTLLYYIATPSFIFMILLNWYIIGVYFAVFALRKFLEGSRWASGILIGLSAVTNLVSALPALGMFFFDGGGWRLRARFVAGVAIAIVLVYIPLLIVNSFPHRYIDSNGSIIQFPFIFGNTNLITNYINYQQNWYIEGSWELIFFNNLDPIRHVILPALFVSLSALILLNWYKVEQSRSGRFPIKFALKKPVNSPRERANLIVSASWMFTLAFLFSTYVFTPQMNLILLPFFVIAPIVKRYWEFLAFDIVNSLVILYGFSQPLLAFGITIPTPVQFGPVYISPVQACAAIRSLWTGKFLIYDGLIKMRKFSVRDIVPESQFPKVTSRS